MPILRCLKGGTLKSEQLRPRKAAKGAQGLRPELRFLKNQNSLGKKVSFKETGGRTCVHLFTELFYIFFS